jgi:glycosyltransferase involved in cell wall biosynthesis
LRTKHQMDEAVGASGNRTLVVRIISRLNIGGPAIQVISLAGLLNECGYDTVVIRGVEGPDEGSMDDLAGAWSVEPVRIRSLRRDVGWRDLLALVEVARRLRRLRPDVVHTHAAKAGAIGRIATLLALRGRSRPVVVHTFHGHSLSGYFSLRSNALFLRIERFLARHTDKLISVSAEVRDELVSLGVAPSDSFDVVPVGFDLSRFVVEDAERKERRAALRNTLGIPNDLPLVTLVARLVPIKRVDRFLRLAGSVAHQTPAHFLIVGGGPLAEELHATPDARALGDRLVWAGFRRDMPDVYFASDLVVQTSDNEGTPVSLIEAQAAGLPVVSTAVGGVPSVVIQGAGSRILDADDEPGFADAVVAALEDLPTARAAAAERQKRMTRAFSVDRLVSDIDDLYRELQGGR